MAMRLSKALRNSVLEQGSMKHAMSGAVIKFYSGAQPATADAAPTGVLLCTYSDAGGAVTREVRAVGSVALTGGASGSVNTITWAGLEIMGSATNFNVSLAQTAQDIVDKINKNQRNLFVDATLTPASTITLTARPGLGALGSQTVASTTTTITKTDTNTTGGVTQVNGLKWGDAATGVLVKDPSQTWQGTAAASGTAGWFRIEASENDAGATDGLEAVKRIDGSIATSGAEVNMPSTSIVALAVQTIASFSITLPTA